MYLNKYDDVQVKYFTGLTVTLDVFKYWYISLVH